jgi:hypothetical protein
MASRWWWVIGALALVFVYFYVTTEATHAALAGTVPASEALVPMPVGNSSPATAPAVASIESDGLFTGSVRRRGGWGAYGI